MTYTTNQNGKISAFDYPVATFTLNMWLQNYGLALLAGICWLMVGAALLATSRAWIGAVEGITMLPPAMLFLLYSYWGNVHALFRDNLRRYLDGQPLRNEVDPVTGDGLSPSAPR